MGPMVKCNMIQHTDPELFNTLLQKAVSTFQKDNYAVEIHPSITYVPDTGMVYNAFIVVRFK